MKGRISRIALAVVAVALSATVAPAGKPDLDIALSLQTAIQDLAAQVGPAVVNIETVRTQPRPSTRFRWRMPQPDRLPPELREYFEKFRDFEGPEGRELPPSETKANGSGVIISADGYILTNEHVINGASKIVVTRSNKDKYDAKVVGTDTRRDLAVLKIDATKLPEAKLGSNESIRRGMFVVAMGSPFGFGRDGQASVSFGIVSGTGRFVPSLGSGSDRYYGNLIQTDAAINPGNSGGPLCNLKGDVIGINTAISTLSGANQGVGFAIPITSETRRVIKRLMKGEKIEYGFLGVQIREPSASESKVAGVKPHTGALIANVLRNTPAAKAGLMPGDIITRINGTKLDTPDQLVRTIGALPVGEKAKLTYVRGGKEREVEVTIAKRTSLARGSVPDKGFFAGADLWRGMRVRDIDEKDREKAEIGADAKGVFVIAVVKDSSADKAGIQPGMIVDQVAYEKVADVKGFKAAIKKIKGDCFVHIFGDGVKVIKAAKGEKPAEKKDKPKEKKKEAEAGKKKSKR